MLSLSRAARSRAGIPKRNPKKPPRRPRSIVFRPAWARKSLRDTGSFGSECVGFGIVGPRVARARRILLDCILRAPMLFALARQTKKLRSDPAQRVALANPCQGPRLPERRRDASQSGPRQHPPKGDDSLGTTQTAAHHGNCRHPRDEERSRQDRLQISILGELPLWKHHDALPVLEQLDGTANRCAVRCASLHRKRPKSSNDGT